jgi:hypothetical protein
MQMKKQKRWFRVHGTFTYNVRLLVQAQNRDEAAKLWWSTERSKVDQLNLSEATVLDVEDCDARFTRDWVH